MASCASTKGKDGFEFEFGVGKLFDQYPVEPLVPDKNAGRKVVTTCELDTGSMVMRERGLAVLTENFAFGHGFCPICFTKHPPNDNKNGCFDIQTALSPIENKFNAAASEALKSTSVGGELIRLWIRIMATVTVLATAKDRVKPTLRHWTQALYGCSELDTSAPSEDWLMDVLVAASTVWECASEEVETAMAQYCFPALQRSPAGKSEESGMGGVEAMVIIAGQMNRNGYSVRDVLNPNQVVALGIFPAVAMYNHSCSPNCAVMTTQEGFLEVRCLDTVPVNVELTVSYVDLLQPREERRAELLASKEFICHCLRCDSPDSFPFERLLSTAVCPRCKNNVPRFVVPDDEASPDNTKDDGDGDGGKIENVEEKVDATPPATIEVVANVSTPSYICRGEDGGCGAVMVASELEKPPMQALSLLEKCRASASLTHRIEILRTVLATTAKTLAPEHFITIRARLTLVVLLQKLKHFVESAVEMKLAVGAMSHLLHPCWPELAEWKMRLAQAYFVVGEINEEDSDGKHHVLAMQMLAATAASLKVCAGENHPLYIAATADLKQPKAARMRAKAEAKEKKSLNRD